MNDRERILAALEPVFGKAHTVDKTWIDWYYPFRFGIGPTTIDSWMVSLNLGRVVELEYFPTRASAVDFILERTNAIKGLPDRQYPIDWPEMV